jgi:hypothetical protein
MAIASALIGGALALGSAAIGSSGQKSAAKAQQQSADAAIAEQRAAREEMRRLLGPYVEAGGPALDAQLAALGLKGAQAQQAFVSQQEQSPFFQSLARQGEESILQNASATGGLRGGNVQGALAQFRPALLNQFLENQYSKLGGMTALGQQSAAGVGTNGLGVASNIGNLLNQAGAARAGGAIASANTWGNALNNIGFFAGMGMGGGGFGGSRLVGDVRGTMAANPGIF